jgi:hypothetical protein
VALARHSGDWLSRSGAAPHRVVVPARLGYLRRAEDALGVSLTLSRPGKGSARGTELTPAARVLLKRLLQLRRQVDGLIGPSGPTAEEIAARARRSRRR